MKINDSIKGPLGIGADKVDTSASKKTEKAPEAKTGGDVTLSPLSAQLQSIEASVSADSVFDAQKVDAIKSAISSGQFKVNSEKVADGLIESVKDLLMSKKTSQA